MVMRWRHARASTVLLGVLWCLASLVGGQSSRYTRTRSGTTRTRDQVIVKNEDDYARWDHLIVFFVRGRGQGCLGYSPLPNVTTGCFIWKIFTKMFHKKKHIFVVIHFLWKSSKWTNRLLHSAAESIKFLDQWNKSVLTNTLSRFSSVAFDGTGTFAPSEPHLTLQCSSSSL